LNLLFRLCVVLLLLTSSVVQPTAIVAADRAPLPSAKQLVFADRVLVIAHRGASRQAPENTLAAFQAAVDAGAQMVELDYYHSADRIPVVFHDGTLERTTDASLLFGPRKIPIESKTLAQLRRLDVGSWFSPKFKDARIATLSEALDLLHPRAVTLIERKGGDAATCVKLLKEKRLEHRAVVQAFDWEYLAAVHRLNPDLVLGALGGDRLTDVRLDQIEKSGARVVGWNHKDIHRRQIDAIHRRGLKVWVYTVNDPARAKELLDDGIDGIITDVPGVMLKTVAMHRQAG